MFLTQSTFYRKYGIRLVQQVMKPVMHDLIHLDLPLKSIYHYVTFDGVELGPPSDDYLFRNIKKPILVGHVSTVGDQKGHPRKQAINSVSLMKDYHSSHRRTKPLRNLASAEKDPSTLIVFNYCFINRMYRYVRSFYTEYYKWYNTFAAVVDEIVIASEIGESQHYLLMSAPKIIPSIQQLNNASKEMSQSLLKVFRDKDSYFLLELWKWLGEDKASSLLSRIPNNKIHLVNVIYQESGKWTILNLGVLNSFRKLQEGQTQEDFVLPQLAKLDPLQLQKRIVRLAMSVMQARTVTANDPETLTDDLDVSDKQGQLDNNTEETGKPVEVDENGQAVELEEDAVTQTTTHFLNEAQVTDLDDRMDDVTKEALIKLEDDQLDKDLAQLNEISIRHENELQKISKSTVKDVLDEPEVSLEDGIVSVCDRLADDGLLTAGEYRRFTKLANTYKTLVSSDGVTTLEQFIKIPHEDLKIDKSAIVPDSAQVLDKSMLNSSLLDFDSKYVDKVLAKDTAGMVMSVQRAGIAVTGYKVEKVKDILGEYEMHTLRLAPVEGLASTLRFKLPTIKEDGSFLSGNVRYRIRKQRGDLPIRKISPNRVALTSYYGKTFINRGRKKADDYGYWLQCQVMAKGLDKDDIDVTQLSSANVFDSDLISPRPYSALSGSFSGFVCKGFVISFDRKLTKQTYPDSVFKKFEHDGNIVFGFNPSGSFLVMDKNGSVYTTEENQLNLFGTLEHFLNIPINEAPVEYAELIVFGKEVPVGVILGYQIGFEKLMRLLDVEPRRVNAGSRVNLESNEYSLVFSDETLVFSRDDKLASIILAGFNEYSKSIKAFSVYSFDKRGVYLNLLEANKLSVRYLREIDLIYRMFIDPITKDLLVEMKEPTTFQGLLFRACEMLLNDNHPDELDPAFMRIKGYERLSGAVYTELVQAIRAHNGKFGKQNQLIDLNPYAVWKRITEDPSKSQVSEINPIKALKEIEAITFAGTGGRNKRSMTKSTRAYHPNDMGTVSESTVDSSDVSINVYSSADPQFTSLRGISKRFDMKKAGPTALLSTSALLAVGSTNDDPKRTGFIAIQAEHSIACDGYHQPSVRTGYEQVVAQRSSGLFAITAKTPCVVKSITAKGIIVEYTDGKVQGYEIGRIFGNAAGLVIPHSVVTPLKEGDNVEVGEAIIYNEGFFEPDFFNPKRVIWKNSANVKTVLWESDQTLEDASSISPVAAKLMSTNITKVKTIIVNFDQSVSKLVSIGDELTSESILCIIEDSITASNNLFNEQTIDTLSAVGAQTPKSHVKGKVEKIEVFYHGDKEDMSDSLLAIVNAGDRGLKKQADDIGEKAYTGSVDSGFRIENNPLSLDTLAIKVYITSIVPASTGDKGVFVHQMKTVFSSIMEGEYITEGGTVINAIFGAKSVADRIVSSPYIVGTSITLLDVIAKKAVAIYEAK
jgi:hypothetical protein